MADAADLIKRYCKKGEEQAFNLFYRQTADKLWRFLVARGADPDSAYDLLAEAFTRFLKSVCKRPVAPVALLFRIAINLQIDSYRHNNVLSIETNTELAERSSNHDDSIIEDDLMAVRRTMKKLYSDEQNLLLMRYWIGMTHREIAEVMEMPEGTIRRQGAAALNKLKELFAE
jgi:RNA polymerase sigma factor (sigma-70 family)